MARDVYLKNSSGMTRRDFLKLAIVGGAGAAASTFLPKNAYPAEIESLAVFDFDVSSLEYSAEDRKKGTEIADKLAHYLSIDMPDVEVSRLRGHINHAELPRSVKADGCIRGKLILDSEYTVLQAKYGDLFSRDIGNKFYKVSARDSELDGAVLDLSNQISTDLNGGRIRKTSAEGESIETLDEFKGFLRKHHPEQYEKQFGSQ